MPVRRLYLIRRDSREFIGPLNADEFKNKLSQMEFGMQDEISGHCGPWVILDQSEPIQHYYPEIASLLSQNLPLSWREVTGHAQVISRQDTRKSQNRKSRHSKSGAAHNARRRDYDDLNELALKRQAAQRNRLKAAGVVVAITCAVIFGYGLKKDDAVATAEVALLAAKADPSEFMNYMGLKVIPNASKLAKNPKTATQWMPYLRMYAFNSTGAVEGISAKALRGDLPLSAPGDCSVEALKKRWSESAAQIVGFTQGKALAKNVWTKIMAMDPHWIKRRAPKGWVRPGNYYEGCVQMALTAVHSLAAEPGLGADASAGMTPEILTAISKRLQTQLDLISSGKTQIPFDQSTVLGAISCLDAAASAADREQCKFSGDAAFRPLLEERQMFSLVHILETTNGTLDQKAQASIKDAVAKIPSEDFMSRAELIAEGKFLGYLISGLSPEQAAAKTEAEFPEIDMRP